VFTTRTTHSQVTPVVVGGIIRGERERACSMPARAAASAGGAHRRDDQRRERGVAVAGDRVFLETDDALIAVNRFAGELRDTALDDWRKNYSASAPLPAGNLIISGDGGEHSANG
jgi:hypothetical protein